MFIIIIITLKFIHQNIILNQNTKFLFVSLLLKLLLTYNPIMFVIKGSIFPPTLKICFCYWIAGK